MTLLSILPAGKYPGTIISVEGHSYRTTSGLFSVHFVVKLADRNAHCYVHGTIGAIGAILQVRDSFVGQEVEVRAKVVDPFHTGTEEMNQFDIIWKLRS